jgi:DNA polymerase-3 subunit beta
MAFSKKGLVLTSRSPDAGEATVNFPCKFEGADMEIGFNPNFLVEALRVANGEEVVLELTSPNRPGLLRGGPNFIYVIMPVNLQ